MSDKSQKQSEGQTLRGIASTEARHFGYFRRLRSVHIENGRILGEWAECGRDEWNPFTAYYANRKPYMALADCGTSDASIARFCESYGPIGEDQSSDFRFGSFDLDEFNAAAWCFRFACALLGSLDRPAQLRKTLLERLDEGVQKRWRDEAQQMRNAQLSEQVTGANWRWVKAIFELRDAAGLTPRPGVVLFEGVCKRACKVFESLKDKGLVSAVCHYLSSWFDGELKEARFRLGFDENGTPRFIAECPDLLASFYWMLAKDNDAGRPLRVCASCGELFFSQRKDAVYCEDKSKKCKESGRMKLYWERQREKINRKRRAKYRREHAKKRPARMHRTIGSSRKRA